MINREFVLNVFSPSAEVEDPASFAGRGEQLLALADILVTKKSVPIIYGARGLGKTSLALQAARIALGDVTLLRELREANRALKEDQRYTTFWVDCSDATRTSDNVIQRLINTAEGYATIGELESRRLVSVKNKKKLKLKLFEAETEKAYDVGQERRFSRLNTEDQFSAVLDTLMAAGYERVLFVIDELDRVKSAQGLANFIKNLSSPSVKFLLVGIGQSISDLLTDHSSLERHLAPVRVAPMKRVELAAIITKAMAKMAHSGHRMYFSEAAVKRLIGAAAGFPWFVHVIGQEALTHTWESHRFRIEESDVEDAIGRLSRSKFAQQFADQYQMAVRDSAQREVVLRFLAKWPSDDIPLSEIYPLAKEMGVTNPSIAKRDLSTEHFGGVLMRPPGHERGVVRFRNAMFKRYIDLRHSMFQDVKSKVDETWKAHEVRPAGG
jgi:hypothetical protein